MIHKIVVINDFFLSKVDFIIFSKYGQKTFKTYSPNIGKSISSKDLDKLIICKIKSVQKMINFLLKKHQHLRREEL